MDHTRRPFAGFHHELNRLLPTDAGKLIQEIFQTVACLQMLLQYPNRHPGAHEYRRTTKNIKVSIDNAAFHFCRNALA